VKLRAFHASAEARITSIIDSLNRGKEEFCNGAAFYGEDISMNKLNIGCEPERFFNTLHSFLKTVETAVKDRKRVDTCHKAATELEEEEKKENQEKKENNKIGNKSDSEKKENHKIENKSEEKGGKAVGGDQSERVSLIEDILKKTQLPPTIGEESESDILLHS